MFVIIDSSFCSVLSLVLLYDFEFLLIDSLVYFFVGVGVLDDGVFFLLVKFVFFIVLSLVDDVWLVIFSLVVLIE